MAGHTADYLQKLAKPSAVLDSSQSHEVGIACEATKEVFGGECKRLCAPPAARQSFRPSRVTVRQFLSSTEAKGFSQVAELFGDKDDRAKSFSCATNS